MPPKTRGECCGTFMAVSTPLLFHYCSIRCTNPALLQSDESVYKVVQLANALETSRFGDFWNAANTCRDLLGGSKCSARGPGWSGSHSARTQGFLKATDAESEATEAPRLPHVTNAN